MGKQSRAPGATVPYKPGDKVQLPLPAAMLPSMTEALRWEALRKHCAANPDFVPAGMPAAGAAWPFQLPPSDLVAYAKGEWGKLSARCLFWRKLLLVLVGGDDLLKSVVELGKFRGGDVLSDLDKAFERIVKESADSCTRRSEQLVLDACLDVMKRGRRITERNKILELVTRVVLLTLAGLFISLVWGWWVGEPSVFQRWWQELDPPARPLPSSVPAFGARADMGAGGVSARARTRLREAQATVRVDSSGQAAPVPLPDWDDDDAPSPF